MVEDVQERDNLATPQRELEANIKKVHKYIGCDGV
jgi:hypothetical protein